MPILLMSKWYMQRKQEHIYLEKAQIVNSHGLAGRGGNRYNWSFNNRMK